jgi:hypothetical protein
MLGEWLTKEDFVAEVTGEVETDSRDGNGMLWIGYITIAREKVPTYWDEEGRNNNDKFTLVEKRRGAQEEWPGKKNSSN